MRVRRSMLSSVTCLTLPYFSTFSPKRQDFRGGKLLNIKCVFWFSVQLVSETFIILTRNERDITINVHTGLYVKYHWSSSKLPLVFMQYTIGFYVKYHWSSCKVPLVFM